MGKKEKSAVGRSILKSRNKGGSRGKGKESWLHTSELNDGEDSNRLNMQSITEQSTLDEFLATAELAGTEFVAANNRGGLPSAKEEQRIKQVQDENKKLLRIPRRPPWDKTMTNELLDLHERESFITWRRDLAELQDKDDLILTPFERNLEFWRQLWRVIERSDVIVQIVDARNPLLFRCEDMEMYVSEVDSSKVNVLLVNKADLLTQEQRETWAGYFKSVNVKAVFWSAVVETERLKEQKIVEESNEQEIEALVEYSEDIDDGALHDERHFTKFLNLSETNSNDSETEENLSTPDIEDAMDLNYNAGELNSRECDPGESYPKECHSGESYPKECYTGESYLKDCPRGDIDSSERQTVSSNDDKTLQAGTQFADKDPAFDSNLNHVDENLSSKAVGLANEGDGISEDDVLRIAGKDVEFYTSGHLLTGEELLVYWQWLHQQHIEEAKDKDDASVTVVGLVGYPNVGKSSTINAILQAKKVPVSATPGRTKHFQTLFVDKNICLCDCPGLVFPSFITTKAEMVVSGILPIDQMRDHISPVSLVCRRIPRTILENIYGINIIPPQEGEDPYRDPYAEELLSAYGYSRGYMTSQGRPDCPRTARYVLKDYVNGKLLFCHPLPFHNPTAFQVSFSVDVKSVRKAAAPTNKKSMNKLHVLDESFFEERDHRSFISATTGTKEYEDLMAAQAHPESSKEHPGKPWKKHGNRNKKEKIRRMHQRDY